MLRIKVQSASPPIDDKFESLEIVADGATAEQHGQQVAVTFPGGGSVPVTAGDGSPVGVVTPTTIGALYLDTTNGGLYLAINTTNADWFGIATPASVSGIAGLNTADGTPGAVELYDSAGATVALGSGYPSVVAAAGKLAALASQAGQGVNVGDDGDSDVTIGFFGASPVVKPTVSDASAAAIIAALAALGLITDGT